MQLKEIALELVHRTCTKYLHVPDSSSSQYSFSARHLADFVEKLVAAVDAERGKDAVGWMWQHEDTGNMGVVDQWQIDNGWEEGNPRIRLIGPLFLSPTIPQWQPIETAPKDGSMLLLSCEFDRAGDWRIKMGYWCDHEDGWCLFRATWTPTHWMPLPPPPAGVTK